MDAFSEILSGVKLNGALFFNAEFSAPWGFAAPASERLATTLALGAPHVVIYHLVTEGRAIACLASGESISLEPGMLSFFRTEIHTSLRAEQIRPIRSRCPQSSVR